MTVRWTVRATNDRRAQFARDQIPSSAPSDVAEPLWLCHFAFRGGGFEVGAVVNDSPVDCQSRE